MLSRLMDDDKPPAVADPYAHYAVLLDSWEATAANVYNLKM
jgi:hypothetical protein